MRWMYLLLLFGPHVYPQISLQGRVIDAKGGRPISNVIIRDSSSTDLKAISDAKGLFKIDIAQWELDVDARELNDAQSLPAVRSNMADNKDINGGLKILTLIAEHDNYQTQLIPVDLDQLDTPIVIVLQWRIQDHIEQETTSGMSEYDDFIDQAIISGPLNAYGDPVSQAEQFDFGAVFYSPMGASRIQKGLVFQGMDLQDAVSGSMQWSMLTGLNQAMRYRKNQNQYDPENSGFGRLGGVTYVGVRPDEFNPGLRMKVQTGNRSYLWGYSLQYVMPKQKGWSVLALVSARDGLSGLSPGNSYKSLGGLMAVEKQFDSGISLGVLTAYTPVIRGMTAPLTREALDLKGHRYNPNWGWQNNTWRNARERFSRLPLGVVSLYSPKSLKSKWAIHLGVIAGDFGQSRLNYSTGANPLGYHYSQMPSYFLNQESLSAYDYYRAYTAQQKFESDGQISWPDLYTANQLRPQGDSQYIIQNQTSRLLEYQARMGFRRSIKKSQSLSLSLFGRWSRQQNFAEISDLLGGEFYYDRNNFYQGLDPLGAWNNINSRNKPLYQGDKMDYDYSLRGLMLEALAQFDQEFKQGKLNLELGYTGATSRRVGHMRHGIFNEAYDSYGASDRQWHRGIKAKIHWAHYWSTKLSSQLTGVYDQQLPLVEQTFIYSRYHNQRNMIQRSPQLTGLFGQLRYQTLGLDLVVKPFVHYQQNLRQNGFFYSDHVRAAMGQSGLVQQHLSGLSQLGIGLRSGIKCAIGERLTWSAVHVYSRHEYIGRARLFLAGTNLIEPQNGAFESSFQDRTYNYVISDRNRLGFRDVYLGGYKPANGPARVLHATLTYRDPSFWWAGLVLSHFSDRYVAMSAYRRSEDAFFQEAYQLGPKIDNHELKALWRQEQLPTVTLASLKMGVSWRLDESYLSVFGSVQNLFNRSFVSGGFESSRKVYIPDLAQDQSSPFGPVFGNKYFPGMGRSYYLTCSINF